MQQLSNGYRHLEAQSQIDMAWFAEVERLLQNLLNDAPTVKASLLSLNALNLKTGTKAEELESKVMENDAYVRAQVVANDTALKRAVEANDALLKTRLHEHSLQVEDKLKALDEGLRTVWSGVDHTLREHTKTEVSALKDSLTSAWLEQSRARATAASAPGTAPASSAFDPQLPSQTFLLLKELERRCEGF